MADNPFENYGLLQRIKDHNLMTVLANPVDAMQHIAFPEAVAQRIKREYPELGPRVDRGLLDMAINFAGGYDWAAREGISPQVAKKKWPGHTNTKATQTAQRIRYRTTTRT